MKVILTLFYILFTFHCLAQIEIERSNTKSEYNFKKDSTYISYYIKNQNDTVWFSSISDIKECDYLVKLEKSHNNCTFYSYNKPMNGFYTISTHNSNCNEIYKGFLKNGKYENGTLLRYHKNGIVQLTGQYQNNWKIGYWTFYRDNGTIDTINKFVDGTDESVVEIIFDQNGKLITITDEEYLIIR